MKTFDMFFSLIRVAIGRQTKLPCVPSDNEWMHILSLLQKHALQGIGFVAMQKLPREQWPPSDVVRSLIGYSIKIKEKNALLNDECVAVVKQLEHDGLDAVVIKGQSNLECYPEDLREYRCAGDIDVWTTLINDEGLKNNDSVRTRDKDCCPQADSFGEQQLSSIGQQLSKKYSCSNREGEIPIAVQMGDSVEYEYYKGVRGIIEYARLQRRLRDDKSHFKPLYSHVEFHTDKGTEVEMHYRPSFLCSPIRNMRMQRWFKEQFDVCLKNYCQLGFPVLTSSVNVVYQLVHLYRHVFEGGIGLRQLMDYYFVLRVWHNDVMECKDLQSQGMWGEGLGTPVMSKEEVMAVLRSFGMGKFAGAVMWVLNEVFGGVNENDNENDKCSRRTRRGSNENDNANENNPQRTRRDTDGGPQADSFGGRQLDNNKYPQMSQIDTDGCPQAECFDERELSQINRELKENNFVPWMICEPNENEGRKLLAEILQEGNFRQYDTRDAELKRGGMVKHGVWKLKRMMRLVRSYPEEALWEPVFRVWHLGWSMLKGY